jgi:S-adenosylmethionine hydrolase
MALAKPVEAVVTLLTDFGTSDHFVAVMKGVILSICRQARIIDITHEVPPHEISQGAYLLAQSWRYFPNGTVHVAVVDPGVGTSRRPILVETEGHYFVGPDNGVLAQVYSGAERHKVREITASKYFLQPVSRTFHGRDIFAAVAGHLAAGVRPASFGKLIQDHLKLSYLHPQRVGKRIWSGTIQHVDRFGNLITNFHVDAFPGIQTKAVQFTVGPQTVHRLALNYADSDPGEVFLIVGSSGFLEVAVNQASAAKVLGCSAGAPVELVLG